MIQYDSVQLKGMVYNIDTKINKLINQMRQYEKNKSNSSKSGGNKNNNKLRN